MSGNKKTWDEKIKLILGELENKISAENAERGVRRKSHGPKYHTKEEKKRAAFRQDIILQAAKSAAFLLATVALVQGIVKVLPDSITVSNTVNGRELPIYCVETEKKQAALSFDAAWGEGRLLEHINYPVVLKMIRDYIGKETSIYIVKNFACYAILAEGSMHMSKSSTQYTVIREYNDLYGFEELFRRIIRRHIKNSENRVQVHPNYKVNEYGK